MNQSQFPQACCANRGPLRGDGDEDDAEDEDREQEQRVLSGVVTRHARAQVLRVCGGQRGEDPGEVNHRGGIEPNQQGETAAAQPSAQCQSHRQHDGKSEHLRLARDVAGDGARYHVRSLRGLWRGGIRGEVSRQERSIFGSSSRFSGSRSRALVISHVGPGFRGFERGLSARLPCTSRADRCSPSR